MTLWEFLGFAKPAPGPSTLDTVSDLAISAVAIPLILWLVQKFVEQVAARRTERRRRVLDTAQLATDVALIRKGNEPVKTAFEQGIESGALAGRCRAPGYAPYVPPLPDGNVRIFGADAAERFSHLSADTFTTLRQFYDSQALIQATLQDFRSDTYKALKAERKLVVLEKVRDLYRDVDRHGTRAAELLRAETARLDRRWYRRSP